MNSNPEIFATWGIRRKTEGLKIAYLSSYPPRECGIATYCQDLLMGINASAETSEPIVVAMENAKCRASYIWPVHMTIDDRTPHEYEAAATYINTSKTSIVCLQHEFGIYGGIDEPSLYFFLRRLEKPLVSILHTVVPKPPKPSRELIRELAWRSDRLVVMNEYARTILARDCGIDPSKISLIHHGAPYFPKDGRDAAKEKLGLTGRDVFSTFGLISRGKGIEYMLEAMPAVVARHPKALYLLIGKTHPGVQLHEKESYRDELMRRVRDLGMENHVQFVNRYLGKPDIIDYLTATDVYVSPYLNPNQIVSGTLAYAMAAGKAMVSTSYLYARFLLNEGRGILVDFRDSHSLAQALNHLMDNPHIRHQMEATNYQYGKSLLWPKVGRQFLSLFHKVLAEKTLPAAAMSLTPSYASAYTLKDDLHGKS